MVKLIEYEKIVGTNVVNEIITLGEKLQNKNVVHISSTKTGGGVAEILQRLVPLLNDVKVDAEWHVIKGDENFFHITKNLHNALHGANIHITPEMLNLYLKTNEENANLLDLNDADFVVVHDPQPAALIECFPKRKGKWIWRCHIDISTPNPKVWDFLKIYIAKYDAVVFHIEKFAKKDLMIRQYIIPPSIDPLSEKNRDLNREEIISVLERFHINSKKPIISQIGRFDHLKDPEGVVKVYHQIKKPLEPIGIPAVKDRTKVAPLKLKESDCQLILAGGMASDDPEGQKVFQDVQKLVLGDKDAHLIILPPEANLEINALQRASNIILQKSLKEGFALTVSEALWKEKPVLGGNTGGIPLQIIDHINGYLVNSIEEAAKRARFLLKNAQKAREMGKAGKEHVRKNFLITRHVKDHLLLYLTLLGLPPKRSA